MRQICGTCKYNLREISNDGKYIDFCCDNEDSEEYGLSTMYDDSCDDWEERK